MSEQEKDAMTELINRDYTEGIKEIEAFLSYLPEQMLKGGFVDTVTKSLLQY